MDTLSKSKTGKDFIDLCKEQGELKAAAEEKARQEEEAKKAENEKKVKEYQTSLNSLQQDYNTYAQYAQSLESDLAYAQQNGEDTADIQSQIDTNIRCCLLCSNKSHIINNRFLLYNLKK